MKFQTAPHIAAFLDNKPEVDETAFIAATATVVGAVRIGAHSSIWYQTIVWYQMLL